MTEFWTNPISESSSLSFSVYNIDEFQLAWRDVYSFWHNFGLTIINSAFYLTIFMEKIEKEKNKSKKEKERNKMEKKQGSSIYMTSERRSHLWKKIYWKSFAKWLINHSRYDPWDFLFVSLKNSFFNPPDEEILLLPGTWVWKGKFSLLFSSRRKRKNRKV